MPCAVALRLCYRATAQLSQPGPPLVLIETSSHSYEFFIDMRFFLAIEFSQLES